MQDAGYTRFKDCEIGHSEYGVHRDRQEPYWVRACPICGRQLRDATSQCCNGEFGKTIYLVPADQLKEAEEDRDKLAAYLRWVDYQTDAPPMPRVELDALLDRLSKHPWSDL